LLASVRKQPEKVIDELIKVYPGSTAEVQLDITAALTGVREASDAKKVIAGMLGPKGDVRPQDLLRWLALGIRNTHTREVFWNYIKDNWKWIEETLEQSKSFDFLPIYVAGAGSTEEWLDDYEKFFKPKENLVTLKQNISVGLSDIKSRVAWRKRDEQSINEWLDSHV